MVAISRISKSICQENVTTKEKGQKEELSYLLVLFVAWKKFCTIQKKKTFYNFFYVECDVPILFDFEW